VAIAALLLCAGASRRFGGDKLLAGAEPLAARSARALREGAGHALAIVPPGADALRGILESQGCEVLATERSARGMGASLAAGVAATAGAAGWIVALGDMPRVRAATIARVKAALERGAAIAAPCDAAGRRGHPVGFSAALREELLALDGDLGARELVARNEALLERIVTDDAGIFVDVDTPADLEALDGARTP
jgi:molybdenum cofactor cytidylyltransferase